MLELTCTARRLGDFESRTEEYEISFSLEGGEPRTIQIKYQAARAFEINAALDSSVEAAREALGNSRPELADKPSDEALSQLTWRTMQSAKYEEGEPKISTLKV